MLSLPLFFLSISIALTGILGMHSQILYTCPSPLPQLCTDIFIPVCGWFDPAQVQCFAPPCAVNKPNPCIACKDRTVKWVSCGKCPEVGNSISPLTSRISNTRKLPKCR